MTNYSTRVHLLFGWMLAGCYDNDNNVDGDGDDDHDDDDDEDHADDDDDDDDNCLTSLVRFAVSSPLIELIASPSLTCTSWD